MPLWSNQNIPPNVNSTTTHASTQGSPLQVNGLVNGKKGSNTVPAGPNGSFGNTSPGSMAGIDYNLYQNTNPGAFEYGRTIGVFGVTANQMANNTLNGSKEIPAHSGWVVRRAGSGPIMTVMYTGTATGYSNGDVVSFPSLEVSATGEMNNASFIVSTNATGGALTFTSNTGGHGFTKVSNNAGTVANSSGGASTGTGATFTGNAGGRAGRVWTETLVAMGSLYNSANSPGNTLYPGN